MLTDDPGHAGCRGGWEINTSLQSQITGHQNQFYLPYIDINYGANERTQLKAEAPYEVITDKYKNTSTQIGIPLLGIKYRFVDEGNHYMSISIYPQIMPGPQGEYIVPFQFEKTIGKFTFGKEVGYLYENNSNNIVSGNLVGYKYADRLELLGEFYSEITLPKGLESDLNFGFRYHLNKHFILIDSFGTELVAPANEQRQYFICYVGLQTVL